MTELENLIAKNGKANGNLVGVDGNAFSLIGYTSKCLKQAKWSRQDIETFQKIALSGDYYNVIVTCDSVLNETDEDENLT
jgi:hypothetical protein